MNSGINYTISSRIKAARERLGISRENLIARINSDSERPISRRSNELQTLEFERFRRWEDGTNGVKHEWIPILCKHLKCEVGYLYGEFDNFTQTATDIQKETGLSSKAVESLLGICKYGPSNAFQALSLILENEDIWKFLSCEAEKVSGKNVLSLIGSYFSVSDAKNNGFIVSDGENSVRLSGADHIRSISNNGVHMLQPLLERTQLDSVVDALKEIKNASLNE